MRYLLIKVEKEEYWYELNIDGTANRQIILDEDGNVHMSCFEDCLAEGVIKEEQLEGDVIYLTSKEFQSFWKQNLKIYECQWEKIKKKYPIGIWVEGVNTYSYPQGSIIKGVDFIAIYKGTELFCLNKSVQYRVKSYDDLDMWLVVE